MNDDLPILPERIARLPRMKNGMPRPYFIHLSDRDGFDGVRFDDDKRRTCFSDKLCLICGEKLGVYKAFLIGKNELLNGISPDPPCHLECAQFAVNNYEILFTGIVGGVAIIWVTKKYGLKPLPGGGYLFAIGKCHESHWYKEGRSMTLPEIRMAMALQVRNG